MSLSSQGGGAHDVRAGLIYNFKHRCKMNATIAYRDSVANPVDQVGIACHCWSNDGFDGRRQRGSRGEFQQEFEALEDGQDI